MSDKAYSVGNAKRQIFLLTDILFRVTYISTKSRYAGIKILQTNQYCYFFLLSLYTTSWFPACSPQNSDSRPHTGKLLSNFQLVRCSFMNFLLNLNFIYFLFELWADKLRFSVSACCPLALATMLFFCQCLLSTSNNAIFLSVPAAVHYQKSWSDC